jgi:hypothetical protein
MRVMRFGLAVVLALGAGFLLVGPVLVLVMGALDPDAPTDLPAGWPLITAGVAIGAALLVVATRLIDPERVSAASR